MQLTQRQKEIIRIIAQSQKEITSEQLLPELKCSLRTLRNEIQKINHSAKGKLIHSSNKGYSIDKHLFNTTDFEIEEAPNQDIYQLLKVLLFEKENWNFYDLSDAFYMSESTLYKRLKSVSAFLKKYNLDLVIKNNNVNIKGKEYDKCRLINFLILNESNPLFLDLESCSTYFLDMNVAFLKQIIIDAVSEFGYYIEDYYAENLYLNIIIALSRISKDFHMEQLDSSSLQKNSEEFQIALKICHSCSRHYPSFCYQENDINYIAMLITGYIKPQTTFPSSVAMNPTFCNAVKDILIHTFNYYMLNIDYESFLSPFLLHVYALIKRAQNHQYLQDITVEDLRTSCPFIYDVSVYLSQQLEKAFQIFIPASEIGYIAIHIGFAIESAIQKNDTLKILLLCSDYHNISRKIQEKLKDEYADSIEIYYASSYYELRKLQNMADLIISVLPLEIIGKHFIKISPFYTALDAAHVNEAINQCLKENERRKRHLLLLSCFHDKLFFIDNSINTKKDAIQFLGDKIEKFGIAPAGFTTSCLQRERASSTCFFQLFAIPHALEMNAKKTMFSVLISPDGILWDEDSQIHLIFMIAVNRNDRKEFLEIYTSIIQCLWDKEKARSLSQVKNFTEFLDFFQ